MELKKILTSTFVLLSIGTSTLFAGTPNIKGVYEGNYNLDIKNIQGQTVAEAAKKYKWIFDFDKGKVTIQNGKVRTSTVQNVLYKMIGAKSLVDNKNGTYTFTSDFQAITAIVKTPKVLVRSVLEITKTSNGLLINTIDSDKDGVLGSVSSTQGLDYSLIFPKKIELSWSGNVK